MILDAARITLGIVLGLAAALALGASAWALATMVGRSRPAWWVRARLAIRRARPTRAGR